MNHWLIAPLVLPLVSGALLLIVERVAPGLRRPLSAAATLALLPLAAYLVEVATRGEPAVYYLGDWPAPFGIVLVLDRLSAMMLALTAVLATASVVYACAGDDSRGPHFHALFQFQLLGVNGAFLTGDLFNLFVFFEILLIASYCLLMHGANAGRTRAAVHVVLLNLTGSALFLIALGLVYAVCGSLNMADLANRVAAAPETDLGLVRAAGLLLLVVFGLKAAFVPLGFWLPRAYRVATAPVACLFAIMTKVGAYAILRVHLLIYGDATGPWTSVAEPWLLPVALVTIAMGTLGLVAAAQLRTLVAYLVVISVGTLLAGIGVFTRDAIAAALFYLVHSTLVTGGLFLLAGAGAIAGLPPASGFLTKVLLLQAAVDSPLATWVWALVLGSGLLTIVSLSRAGSALFWSTDGTSGAGPRARAGELVPTLVLIGAAAVLVVAAAPMDTFTEDVADQLLDRGAYVDAVLANAGVSTPASASGAKP